MSRAGAPPGRRQGCQRHPPLLAAALGVGLAACLLAFVCVHCRLETVRAELAQLRGELLSEVHGPAEDQRGPRQGAGDLLAPIVLKGGPLESLERNKREVERTPQKPPHRHRKLSALHLVPARHASNDKQGATEIWWKPSLKQGRALEPSGQDIVVKHTGIYFVYSQVLFHDPTFTMGQVLQRQAPGRPNEILFRCVQSMPANPDHAYNSCYSGGIFHLQPGDRLNLHIPRINASFDASPHGTFLGLLRL